MDAQIRTIDSVTELREIFGRLAEPKILIVCNDSNPNQYNLISVNSCTIGIIDRSFGVPIQVEELKDGAFLLIGHESQLDCVSLSNAHLRWQLKLNSVFFQFKIYDLRRIIIIEEAGVLAIDYLGKKIWTYATDIITESVIVGNQISIKTIEDSELKISVITGELLR
jgi:hypothetical protein